LGRVTEVLETGANDVYVVRGPRGEVLIPAIESVVRVLDVEAKRMVVSPLPGMLDESG
jgi:16S rRNA processing protein RimM